MSPKQSLNNSCCFLSSQSIQIFQKRQEKTWLGSFLFPLFCSVLGHQVEPVVQAHRAGCLLLILKQKDVWQNKFFKSNKIITNYTHKQVFEITFGAEIHLFLPPWFNIGFG